MNGLTQLIPALFTGVLLGLVFFGGLWITLRHLGRSTHPIRLLLSSFVLRSGIVISGFFAIATHFDGSGMVIATAAFFVPRFIMLRASRSRGPQGNHAHDHNT